MKAIIIGAGIGGLCAGLVLKRNGWDVNIYERVREVRPVGAALSLWCNGVMCFNHIGVGKQVADLGGQMDNMSYVDGLNGETMTQFSLLPLYDKVGQRPYPVARADLQEMLMREFGLDKITLGAEFTELKDDGEKVTAYFADGSTDSGDLLIGADGAHSKVRAHVLGEVLERHYSGYVNWNGLVEIDESIAPADQWTTFVAEGKRASVMPIADNRFYFFFDTPIPAGQTPDRSEYRDLLHGYFEGWDERVHKLIDKVDIERLNRVEVHDIEPFMTWVKGRVAILGDAAHNTSPDIGQGACMAVEDVVVLEQAVQKHGDDLAAALAEYETLRTPRAADLVLRARHRGEITHAIKDPEATRAWYEELRRETGEHIMHGLTKNIEGMPAL